MADEVRVTVDTQQRRAMLVSSHGGNAYGGAVITITRPADTTAYAAGDVVGATAAALDLGVMGPAGGRVKITSSLFMVHLASINAGMAGYRLHLYNVTPPSAYADNAPWDLLTGDRASYLGYIDLGTPVDIGGTLVVQADAHEKVVKLLGTNLFAYLVTNAAYTPTSAEVMSLTVSSS